MALGTVAVVFTDLVGSTELSNRIGPVASETLRREHFSLLRDACDAAGGTEVKNLGDGLMLAFTSPTAAIEAAVEAQQAIEARNRTAEVRFEVRIGVAFGEANEEGGDWFGEPVVLGARLCNAAHGGQILVTDVARSLASSSKHRFASVGALALKGVPEAVPAHEVLWVPAERGAIPLPVRLRGAPEIHYVGRGIERGDLGAGWQDAVAGRANLVLLAGEPGIGKTRLASHHAFSVHEAGGTVLYGAVDEGLSVPYQPWIEAIGHYVEHAPDPLLQRYVQETGPDLARLSPTLLRRLPDLAPLVSSDGETERYLLLEAVAQLLRTAAAERPVLVVLDDLHWADKPTLLMLTHLHRSLADAAVQFVGTYRDSDITSDHLLADVLATLRREPRVERIDLTGLERVDIVELLRLTSNQEPDADAEAFARLLHRDTAGNPLFLAEVLRDLLETGGLAPNQGRWGLTMDLDQLAAPASVREVVLQRVNRLGTDAQRVLSVAAVIGRDFELALLAAALGEDLDDIVDTIDAAMAASLLTESGARPGGLRFIHALIAQALSDGLTPVRRAQLHRHVARTIEDLHGPDLGDRIGAVAGHLLAANDEPLKTIDYVRRAGQHALAALAPDEAMRWFTTALDLLDRTNTRDEELRCDLLADLGDAKRDAAQPGAREDLVESARTALELRDGDRAARAVLSMGTSWAISIGRVDAENIAMIEAALALCPERDITRARLLGLLAAEQMAARPLAERTAIADDALSIARGMDEATLAQVLSSVLAALWTAPAVDQRVCLVAELRELAERLDDPTPAFYAAIHGAWAALERCDRAALALATRDLRSVADRARLPAGAWARHVVESFVASVDGDLALAEQEMTAALEVARSAGVHVDDAFTAYHAQLGSILLQRGELGEAVDFVQTVVDGVPSMHPMARSMVALAHLQAGDRDKAAVVVRSAIDDGDPAEWIQHIGWAWGLAGMGIAAAQLGEDATVVRLYALSVDCPEVVAALPCGAAHHLSTARGVMAAGLGRRAPAIEHFTTADAELSRFGAPLLLAYNRLEHARALLGLGVVDDRDRARELLTEAARAYSRHGCPRRVAECEELLDQLSGGPDDH